MTKSSVLIKVLVKNMIKESKTLTKWILYVRMMKPLFIIALGFWTLFIIIAAVAATTSPSAIIEIPEFVQMMVITFIGIIIIMALPFTLMAIRDFSSIKKQEQYFGFKFFEQMKQENIVETPYKSKAWYINAEWPTIIAMRKDYIQSIERVEYYKSGSRGSVMLMGKVTLQTVDGKKIKYHSSDLVIREFVKWLSFQSHVNICK